MLEVDLLGPVEVRVSGVDVALSPLERNLLTLLALTQGIALSTERIIDQLWGDRLPASPRSRVQGLISSLRRKIGDVLVTRHPGYLLDRTQLEVDVEKCERFAFQASTAGSTNEAAELLRRALAVWRGEPLDGVTAPGADADRTRFAELRVGLLEARFDAELELGRHIDVVAELAAAVAEHPLRERLAGQHMTALYRASRRADALHAYQALRERLADELGSDPCHDLRALHASILRGGDAAPAREGTDPAPGGRKARRRKHAPAQLPPGVGHFTGRDAELRALTEAIAEQADEPRVAVVTSAAGLGKTALVVRWAHSVADRFPDGQVFLDLRGHDSRQALSPEAALTGVLAALGTSQKKMPTALPDLLAAYRTVLNGRRVLIVADNAGSVTQVAALVPPTSGSQLVVTGRRRLPGLSTQHAVRELTVEPLPRDAARDLLRRILGQDRLRDPALDDVLRWCGGWPLALRHVAAKLAARPGQPVASFLEELHAVTGLVVDGDTRSVHSVLTDTLRCVSPAAARLFGRLRRVSDGVTLAMAAATADAPAHEARVLLDELVATHLLVEDRSGWFRCHDVVRRFATEPMPDVRELITGPARRPVVDSQRI
ncbi:MAG: BTAD domain-containing putative transcriptional regulator [Actinophytocola sp.]|uniref:AfsR/SARP family transcriptional regulator n=1 Tax=Actinophytocola sp. TaxID=1872138 RepID=UPI003C78D547